LEFGSGVVLEDTGVTWQNRGASFALDPASHVVLAPGRKPFHTLNPAFARLADGREIVYGNMGGDGQPQSQAAVFSRYAMFGHDLRRRSARRAGCWGTWGQMSVSLKRKPFRPGARRRLRRRRPRCRYHRPGRTWWDTRARSCKPTA
jgi:gamma-glutamyltranspeptidase/glutathione hydrolase